MLRIALVSAAVLAAGLPTVDSTTQHAQAAFAQGLSLRGARVASLESAACQGQGRSPARMAALKMSEERPAAGGFPATRRDALMLALAAGTAGLGARGAWAEGTSGPAAIDGPSPDRGAIRSNAPGKDRNRIKVAANKGGGKEVKFPTDAKSLTAEYNKTESGMFYKVLKVGEGDVPKPGDVLELNYVGSVCSVDKDGEYDCDPGGNLAEIYPTMPQGIVRDSPRYDSSFDRGRTLQVSYKKAQLSLGLEEAVADMKPGGAKLVFLVPELSIACPRARVCVADIEPDERMAFYLELVAINPPPEKASATGQARQLVGKRKRLFGPGPPKPEEAPPAAPGAPGAPTPAPPPAPAAPGAPRPPPRRRRPPPRSRRRAGRAAVLGMQRARGAFGLQLSVIYSSRCSLALSLPGASS